MLPNITVKQNLKILFRRVNTYQISSDISKYTLVACQNKYTCGYCSVQGQPIVAGLLVNSHVKCHKWKSNESLCIISLLRPNLPHKKSYDSSILIYKVHRARRCQVKCLTLPMRIASVFVWPTLSLVMSKDAVPIVSSIT